MGSTTSTVVPYFLYSSGILFREGLEAMLVIIALVAGTRQAGQGRHARDIYTGALIALASSIVLAWVVNHVIGDNTSDTLEGVFQLFAAATLFYVSSWITSKAQAQRWRKFISTQVEIARRSKGPSLALGLTAFLAVMREGAETIVFFQALAAGATETARLPASDRPGLLRDFGSPVCARGHLRRTRCGKFPGIGRAKRDLHQSRADDSDAGNFPDRADADRASDSARPGARVGLHAARAPSSHRARESRTKPDGAAGREPRGAAPARQLS